MKYDENGEEAQREYAENVFVGVGQGRDVLEAMKNAYDAAWERAKRAGKTGRPLRVAERYVSGENPPNWYKIVLVADG